MSRVLPILFNTYMVRAILDGRKTATRRLIKPRPKSKLCYTFAGSHKKDIGRWGYPSKTAHEFWGEEFKLPDDITEEELKKKWNPPYHTDDILYVRETWQYIDFAGENNGYVYKASENGETWETESENWKWHPSIHMPKEAARIWLKVKDVRVERLQDITEEHAQKEGCQGTFVGDGSCMGSGWDVSPVDEFSKLWDSTIKKSDLDHYGWDANPWVWVIEFERCEKPED